MLSYHDRFVPDISVGEQSYKSVDLTDEALTGSDLILIATDHPGVDYARVVQLAERVLDTRNATSGLGPDNKVEKL